jgi:hypothetical protein
MLNTKNRNLKLNFILFLFVLLLLFSSMNLFILRDYEKNLTQTSLKLRQEDPEKFYYNCFQLNDTQKTKWVNEVKKVDKDLNGFADLFEKKLDELLKNPKIEENAFSDTESHNFKNNVNDELNNLSFEQITIIIKFPEGEYNTLLEIFKDFGGNINSTFKHAINGFAGTINYDGLMNYKIKLDSYRIPYLIEHNSKVKAQLYYATRNMNVRPYVWDTLNYNGSKDTSIAILDTGLDDEHDLFQTNKIIAWQDFINSKQNVYDDNGHGSHVGAIAAGNGSVNLDSKNRTVSVAEANRKFKNYQITQNPELLSISKFNVTKPGKIIIYCNFSDFTGDPEDIDARAHIYKENDYLNTTGNDNDNWVDQVSLNVDSNSLGMYELILNLTLKEDSGDGNNVIDSYDINFRGQVHWPFDPPFTYKNNTWNGVSPNNKLVGVKVLDRSGSGSELELLNGIEWVLDEKENHNITVMSLSLGFSQSVLSVIDAVNNAVENGVVTIVAAGNSGKGSNNINSPGDADNVITVAATNSNDNITYYSSQGGFSYSGNTIKPDITAPGGGYYDFSIFSADTDDNDLEGEANDKYQDDLKPSQGTSMSTPAVSGAASLLIDAMGGSQNWAYSASKAKTVKALLLMSATETYPLKREVYPSYSPTLERGGKDAHEGYGRINIDAAIEAFNNELKAGEVLKNFISSSLLDSYKKHGFGCHANLKADLNYQFTLDVPSGADFDIYVYDDDPDSIGEPILLASGTNEKLGEDEKVFFKPSSTGKYYIVVKAISGQGDASLRFDLSSYLSFFENLDSELSKWEEIGGLWHKTGSDSQWTNSYYSDNQSFWFGKEDTGNYDTGEIVSGNLTSRPFDLSNVKEASLELYHWKELDGSEDVTEIYLSTDNSHWNLLYSDSNNIPNWEVLKLNLNAYAGYKDVQLRFHFDTKNELENDYRGWLIDDIRLEAPIINYSLRESSKYDWIDASDGVNLNFTYGDYSEVHLPFTFRYFNNSFSKLSLSSFGYVSFSNKTPNDSNNQNFPSNQAQHYLQIAPFWDDINISTGNLFIKNFTSYWIAQWDQVSHNDGNKIGTFQLILYESGNIVFNYKNIDYVGGNYTSGLNFGKDTNFYNFYEDITNDSAALSISFIPDNSIPKWQSVPEDIIVEYGEGVEFDITAYDPINIENYWINEGSYFSADSYGLIKNITSMEVNTHNIVVRAYDPFDQYSETKFKIIVQDTTSPEWVYLPSNITVDYGEKIEFMINATDLSGIKEYLVNNSDFSIINNNTVSNSTILSSGNYTINVSALDPYNNSVNGIVEITILQREIIDKAIPSYDPKIILLLISSGIGIIYVITERSNKFKSLK